MYNNAPNIQNLLKYITRKVLLTLRKIIFYHNNKLVKYLYQYF